MQQQKFTSNGTFTPPAGITSVQVTVQKTPAWGGATAGNGSNTGFVLSSLGTIYASGDNTNGSLGVGDVTSRSIWTILAGGFTWKSVWNAGNCTFAENASGGLYSWGGNVDGRLGQGDIIYRSTPTLISAIQAMPIKAVKLWLANGAGLPTFAVLNANGQIYTWGYNTDGRLGQNNSATATITSVPTLLSAPVARFHDVVTPGLALGYDGHAYAWGANTYGQLGTGDLLPRSSPVAVTGGLTFGKLYMSGTQNPSMIGQSVWGLTPGGALYAWGYNGAGQLGTGDQFHRSTPTLISTPQPLVALYPNWNNIIGLTADGTAYVCGSCSVFGIAQNSYELGLGPITSVSSFTAVLGGLKFSKIIPGGGEWINTSGYYMGITPDAKLYGWGYNSDWELGLGDINPRSSPVLIASGIADVVNQSMTLAAGVDGSLWGWGFQGCGQLGLADTVSRSTPTLISGPHWNVGAQQSVQTVRVPVTPGTQYSVNVVGSTSFGSNLLSAYGSDSLTVFY